MAKASTASGGPVVARLVPEPGRVPLAVNFQRPGPNIAGSTSTQIRSDKTGYHYGWTIEEDAVGVVLSKGPKAYRVPWSQVVSVEYVDA